MIFSFAVNGESKEVRAVRVDPGFEWTISQKVTHAGLHLIDVSEDNAVEIALFNGESLVRDIKFAELKKLLEDAKLQREPQGRFRHFYLNLSCEKNCKFDRVAIRLNPDTYIRVAEFAVAGIRASLD